MRALVTGGTRGIGAAIVRTLEDEGHTVVTFSRNAVLPLDVLDPVAVGNFMRSDSAFDILINNVGGGGRWGEYDAAATKSEVWDHVFQKNAGAAIQFTTACLPHMVASGFGRVVCITSIYAHRGAPRPWFGMAKAAEAALMASLAKRPEYVRRGITFNCVAPGHIDTGGMAVEAVETQRFPLGRMGTAMEVANVVAFLCSPEASLVNGANIIVDGGESV